MSGIITAIEPQQRRRGKRVNVFVDGHFAFSLDAEVAATSLRVGQPLNAQAETDVLQQDEFRRALDVAVRFLGNRPRSEREIRRRLGRESLPPATVDEVVARLRHWQLVDDSAFARYWVEQRQTFRPRGARVLKAELRQRGVSAELASQVADETQASADDDAYRAAAKKARQLATARLDERTFRNRLGQFLGRRGFDWDTIAPTVERLWQETTEPLSRS